MHVRFMSTVGMLGLMVSLSTPSFAQAPDSASSYEPQQVIVKFADSIDACSAAADLVQEFSELMGQTTLQPLMGKPCDVRSTQELSAIQQEIKARYSYRSQRAPLDAEFPKIEQVFILSYEKVVPVESLIDRFRQHPQIDYAQPNYIVQTSFTPTAAPAVVTHSAMSVDSLWGLQRIQAPEAWSLSQGQGVVVAVIDTGVDLKNPDLKDNLWTNVLEVPNNGIDDDRNGFIDDVQGWDFAEDSNEPMDENGHGTHVAGIIAAVGHNAMGVVGVAPQAHIMPIKALGVEQGTSFDLARAMIYATRQGADVINNSWGCSAASDAVLESSVRYAYSMGAVVVFAAGNDAQDVQACSPQNMSTQKPIIVAASTTEDKQADFSNVGLHIDVAAPSEKILSLRVDGAHAEVVSLDGTSMAAPHVAGIAALLFAYRPTLSNEAVRQIIRASAEDIDFPGFDPLSGAGRVNALKALNLSEPVQANLVAPSMDQSIYAGQSEVVVEMQLLGYELEHYRLSYREAIEDSSWLPLVADTEVVESDPTGSWVVSGLAPGTYILRLEAITSTGQVLEDLITVERL